MTLGTMTVKGRLVRYLRKGVRGELGASIAILQVEVDTILDPGTYFRALKRFDEARGLLDAIGVVDDPDQADVDIDLELWPQLIVKALEAQHDIEVMRLEDAAADGYTLPMRDVPALRGLVDGIRQRLDLPPRSWHTPLVLNKRRANARRLRWGRRHDG
jgi:hypothetical protein